MESGCCHIARSHRTPVTQPRVFTCQRFKSSPYDIYRVLLLSKSQTHVLPFASVQLPWGKNKTPVNLFTASFVFCGVVKLKTTCTNILIIKRTQGIYINSAKAVCIKEKLCDFKERTKLLYKMSALQFFLMEALDKFIAIFFRRKELLG